MPWWNMNQYSNLRIEQWGLPFIIPTIIWSLIWKGFALYRAARNEQKGWFVTLLVVNTLGILEIIYLIFFSNTHKKTATKKRA